MKTNKMVTDLENLIITANELGNQDSRLIMLEAWNIIEDSGVELDEEIKTESFRRSANYNYVKYPAYYPDTTVTIKILHHFIYDLANEEWDPHGTPNGRFKFLPSNAIDTLRDLIKFTKMNFTKLNINTDEGQIKCDLTKEFMDSIKNEIDTLKKEQAEIKSKLVNAERTVEEVNTKIAEAVSTYEEIIDQLKIGNKEKAEEDLSKLSKIFKWLGRNILQPAVSALIGFSISK